MKFVYYEDAALEQHNDLVEEVKRIAMCDEICTHRAWFGPHPDFDGWFIQWSMNYLNEDTDPDSREPDAYGLAKTSDGKLMFRWTREGNSVEVSSVSYAVTLDL